MVSSLRQVSYLLIAASLHIVVFLILILSYEFTLPQLVFENTPHQDVISAVVLGDSVKSKIIHDQTPPPPPVEKKVVESAPPKAKEMTVPQKKDVLPLKKEVIKKPTKINKADEIAKALLADIDKHKKKRKVMDKKVQENFQKTLKQNAEKTLREQLFNEDIKLKAEMSRKSQGIVNQYAALIKQSIGQHWVFPASANKNLRCKLNIRLAPNGAVLDVQVIKSSGDLALDHSARAAVFNASPLPVPKDATLFQQFRVFEMDVSPKDIIDHA